MSQLQIFKKCFFLRIQYVWLSWSNVRRIPFIYKSSIFCTPFLAQILKPTSALPGLKDFCPVRVGFQVPEKMMLSQHPLLWCHRLCTLQFFCVGMSEIVVAKSYDKRYSCSCVGSHRDHWCTFCGCTQQMGYYGYARKGGTDIQHSPRQVRHFLDVNVPK